MIDRACISLGERCNLQCQYCHFEDRLTGRAQEFNDVELISIADNINSYVISNDVPLFKIGIVGSGEPILEFSKIVSLIAHIRSKNIKRLSFYTISNSILITKEKLQFFWENKDLISLSYSFDGYEDIHNFGRGSFKKVFRRISEYESIFGHKPSINCTVHKKSVLNAHALLQYFEELNFPNITFSKLVDSTNSDLSISNAEYSGFLELAKGYKLSIRQHRPGNENKVDCVMYGNICGVGRTNIFFTKLGVYPSGRFYANQNYLLGEASDSLHEIEEKMKGLTPVNKGECYYDKNVQGVSL